VRIFTGEVEKYRKLVEKLEMGIVAFNSGSIVDCDLPIEGWKGSGKGKILSELSYEEYLLHKSFIVSEEI
jgi:acyl-CoA reductase-like NAD-dependent aldehyde dehydrogenase